MTKLQIPPEVFPSLGLELTPFPIRPDQPHPRGLRSTPDPRYANSRDLRGYHRRGCKQQFIIVAAVQGQFEPNPLFPQPNLRPRKDRKSTRLNSSHSSI